MLFVWPSVFATAAARHLLTRPKDRAFGWGDLTVLTVLGAPVFLLLFPVVWAFQIGLNITAAPIIAATVVLMLVLLLPLFEIATCDSRWWLPGLTLGLAAAFTALGMIDARPGPGRPLPGDLVYALDRESNNAMWATMQDSDDGWIERFVDTSSQPSDLAPFLAGNQRPYRLAAAPLVEALPAATTVVADVTDGRVRTVAIEIRSAIGPELMNISPAPGSSVALRAVNGVRFDGGMGPGGGTAPSPAAGDWLLQHYGGPPEGVLLLELQSERLETPIEFVLVEFFMRLPPIPGAELERPPGVVAHGRRLTDVSLFRQVLAFE
jgi:hypothetical protein